jgi:prevent-host-death family protein
MREVGIREAKASLSNIIRRAAGAEVTVVTRYGAPVAVVLGHGEWQRLTSGRPGFADLLLSFPKDSELCRDDKPARAADL